MPKALNIFPLITLLLSVICGTTGLAQTELTEEEKDLNDPIIPLEEAMAAIDRIAPLPTEKEGAQYDASPLVFPDDVEPDLIYLKYLQIQERIAEREALEAANNALLYDNFFKLRQSPEVCDPMDILTYSEYQVLQDIILSYSEKYDNPVFINLLKEEQLSLLIGIPQEQHESALSKHPDGIMVYYFYDQPKRTRVHFGKAALQTIPYEKQKTIIAKALSKATAQKTSFNAIYEHLTSLTSDLSLHNSELPPQKKSLINKGESNSASIHRMEATKAHSKGRMNAQKEKSLPFSTLTIVMGGVLICSAFLALKLKKGKRPQHILISPQEPVLGFSQAKDTSQAIKFSRNTKKASQS